ncbi:hypothetical protein M2480_002201 [Parabacteroides sp. PFB2-12]|uniref:ORF6N domain-containing protein n=1 Tax=unclassified Parabacteroides TaxID=2649774 RepID=UPI0024761137|nr:MULTISPECIES: ORF6N domain-containing protein [unclassified Parabacteroides]MDH6343848.1 hypothetical protein [Parabacteroides sp. PM6-13]MDH6391210.1 hypothetical protein [Parabacteroides sp. PFB2-12]
MKLISTQNNIYEIRGSKVMFDFDLADMYRVETRRLKEQVKRNLERFPSDFMFQLTKEEWQEVIANCDNLPEGVKFSPSQPFAFTQEGVAMLSGVLRSPVAVQVNISIMRAFVAVRNVLTTTKEENMLPALINRIKALEEVSEETFTAINDLSEDTQKEFDDIYIALAELAAKHKQENKPRNPIGFRKPEE